MFPPEWGAGALMNSGLPRDGGGELTPVRTPAAELIARLARRHAGLQVVALAPLTEVAAVLREHPAAYARLGGDHHDGGHGRQRVARRRGGRVERRG